MIKKFMITTSILLVLFVIGGLSLSPFYTVKSYITIKAPLEKVHALISDLEQWGKWSPWLKYDDSIKIKQAKGLGATQTWQSPRSQGRLIFTKVDKNHGVSYDIFFNGDTIKNQAEFIYEKDGENVKVTWTMSGEIKTAVVAGYVAFMTEHLSGASLDEGLINLKREAQKTN